MDQQEEKTPKSIKELKTIDDYKPLLEDYLINNYGLYSKENPKNNIRCINAEAHKHGDRKPSLHFFKETNSFKCFACGIGGDLIDFIKIEQGLSTTKEALQYLDNYYLNKPLPSDYKKNKPTTKGDLINFEGFLNTLEENETEADKRFKIEYLKTRGFNEETAQAIINYFRLKLYTSRTKSRVFGDYQLKDNESFLIIPHRHYINGFIYSNITARNTNPNAENRYIKAKGTKASLYDPMLTLSLPYDTADALNIFLIEGEIDALTLVAIQHEARKQNSNIASYNAIALSSTSNTSLLLQELKERKEKARNKYNFILMLDNDEAGENATNELIKGFEELGLFYYKSHLLKDLGFKDVNEAYINDKDGLTKAFLELVENYKQLKEEEEATTKKEELQAYINAYSVFNSIETFKRNIKESQTLKPTSTGFKILDDTLFNGGIPKGLLTIGAISSLGKTTLILQITDQIAQTRQADILYFSLEMSKEELIAKSVSRLTFLNAKHLKKEADASNTLDIMQGNRYLYYNDTKKELIENSINDYTTFAKNIYIIESVASEGIGIKEIEDGIKRHIAKTGNKPIVIIDYLQIMKTPNERLSDKQAIDKNITTLKRLSAENSLLIIAISSLSRANYTNEVDIASFKESGAIEYTSDILLGLDFYALTHLEEQEDFKDTSNEGKNQRTIKKLIKEAKDQTPRKISLTILKNRNGRTGQNTTFYYYPAYNCFLEEGDHETLYKYIEASRFSYSREAGDLNEDELPF